MSTAFAWIGTRLSGRGDELRLALRMTVSGVVAFALAELFRLEQGYWAVFTAIIVVQASVGRSLKTGIDRLLGTIGGAAYGALVGLALPHADPVMRGVTLAAAVAPLALLAALRASFRIAPVTAVIVLLSTAGESVGPLAAAAGRVSEIGLGCLVGLAVSLLVLPARAHGLVARTASRSLTLQAELLGETSRRLGGAGDPERARSLHDRSAALLRQLDMIGREAERERRSRLSGAPDAEPLIRAVRRLRADLLVIARAGAAPLAEPGRALLQGPAEAALAAVAETLRGAAAALAAGRDPPGIAGALAALDGYAAAMDGFRQAQPAADLPDAEAERIFALSFALQLLRGDLRELDSSAGSFARRRATKV